MPNFEEINEARKILNLGGAATLKEIKTAYRRLAARYHPDKQAGSGLAEAEETMKRLNWAYKLLMDYCTDYKYSFKQEDVARTYPQEEYMREWRENWFNSI
jgi:DnaJ-class molecular chaperone